MVFATRVKIVVCAICCLFEVLKMSDSFEPQENNSIEVALIPESKLCGNVGETERAGMAQGCSLFCGMGSSGELTIGDLADGETSGTTLSGPYSDFAWEEVSLNMKNVSSSRLLAVSSQCDLRLLEVRSDGSGSVSLACICECSADRLVQMVTDEDHSVSELVSLRLLSFADGRYLLLINSSLVLQMLWEPGAEEVQSLSCCTLQLPETARNAASHVSLRRGTLFVLTTSGIIYMFDSAEGTQLASMDLPAYLSSGLGEEELPRPSSFSLFQVSADLSTGVAATRSQAAVAVDLNHYFRSFPDHLLCGETPSQPTLKPLQSKDQDSVSSSTWSQAALGMCFSTDRSWEARLASMYNKAQAPSSPSQPAGSPWFSGFPHPECSQALNASRLSQSRVPPGGAIVTFSVPESASPCLLSVSEFSTTLTFTCPSKRQSTVALWDFQSQCVSYHRAEKEAVPVQLSGEHQLSLLLKKSGLSQVLFGVSQQDLLSRLMVFGSAATVDALCHLNAWGRCSIPLHSLQAGVKNRQLDTVDFFLKSKESILNVHTESSPSDQPAVSTLSLLNSIEELCPALDLLCSAIRDSHSEAQGKQFAEQLLGITVNFLNRLLRSLLSGTQELDASLQSCVDILDVYITELRRYMRRFPWRAGNDVSSTDSLASTQDHTQGKAWDLLTTEEVVQQAILSGQIPRAQAYLRRCNRPEQTMEELRRVGLRQAFSCLVHRELPQASALLRNMGFNVKKQLHSICMYTHDKDLREFVVEELSRRSYFSEEEKQRVMFIREMERLGSLPATRCISPTTTSRFLEMAQTSQSHKEVLEELVRERMSQDEAGLWSCLRLDWVQHWEPNTQTTILLSRLQDTGSSCDAAVLWYYLTSLHDQQRLVCWIKTTEDSGNPQWPELTPEMVSTNTACSSYLRELILYLLARGGLFTQAEMADFELLLWRLGQAGGVMAASPPVPQYRSPNGLDFHSQVVTYCLDNNLQYLLYTYLEHYRLTPRNCPILSSKTLYENQPWFEMLVKVQEITRDLSDPRRVFETSVTSAQVLLPGGQTSVSSLLLEGHSLLALATIMFAPGGIDQVLSQGETVGRSACRVDAQVLKMALAPYPKLRSALFPSGGGRGNSLSSDVSIYHLMQSLHPLDPSRLFGWQAANTLRFTESSELPHFSSPHLVNKYALIENLDSLYYLRHGRPSFAYATFLIQHLDGCADVKILLSQAAQQAYNLTMLHFNLPSVTTACVCFCELLGVCSLRLRVDLRALGLILQHWNQTRSSQTGLDQHVQTLVAKASKLLEAESGAAEELIGYLEAAVMDSLEKRGIRRSSYEAGHEWAVPVQFCQLHSLTLSSVYPAHCAADGQWIYFLLFVQLHSFPPQQVRALAAQFSPSLQAHLTLAFEDLQVHNQWRNSGPEQQVGAQGDTERLARYEAPEERPRELFQVLLQSQEETSPWRHLLREALELRCSTLTILAACHQEADLLQCLCVWVLTSIDEVTAREASTHLDEAPRHHEWNLHDLSIIWKTLLGRGQIRPLLRGFQFFQRDCPLIQVLLMFELCCDYRKYPEAKAKLLDFQKSLITLRSSASVAPGGLPLQWVECQASVLLLTMMQRCSSQYDLHKLLQLLAEVERLLKSNGPDFKQLSQLSELVQGTSVSVSPRLLQSCSPEVERAEYQDMVLQLQARGLFNQARQVAELAGLPIDSLLISQLLQDVTTQKAKQQWSRMETRVSFWKKCHDQFKTHSTDPESASQFFLSQAEVTGAPSELLSIQERCLLLCLAGHWLSLLHHLPVARLEALEKQLWTSRLHQQVLLFAMEKESVFNLPAPAVSPELNSYEVLMKEFSFSNISALNQDKHLRLPGPSDEQKSDSELGPEERSFLASLVDQLLDEGGIYEASRVCWYFSLFHRNMCLVLHCRGLASGELDPQPQEVTSEATSRGSVASSSSPSSLSSFVMVPLPEDQVVGHLQSLVSECCHGNNYCKQVLSLYQLSKELQCSFREISKEDPQVVLGKLLLSNQPERFKKAQAFIRAQGLTSESVAQLVSSAVAQGLLAAAQESEPVERQVYRPSDGREVFLQLVRLCDDPNLVGIKLLEHLSTVPLRDLECTVELLILAHDCFSVTCNMEGIVRVLQAARHLSHAHLAPSEHYGLLVRLLTGIGRYNEMTYIFDLLHQNHRFEILLRKKLETDRGQSSGLKTALLDYIKRCLPGDSEKHNMVALCFSMRREIGENHEMAARTQLKIIESQPWVVTSELKSALQKVLALLKDAAESYSKDSCVRQAASCVRMAKLVLLQLHFLNHDSDQRVINLLPSELLSTIVTLPRCYQVFVVSEAYNYSPDWAEVLYQKVILNGDFVYLEELKRHRPLTAGLFEDISKKLSVSRPPGSATQNLKRLLGHCDDIYTQYRLAYHHQLHDLANMLLQDAKTSSYLSDKLGS
ncbi:spatacsin [Lampris incognitus]|uniref:spatacsin n=1 Tax=Lampris incognitus TaxID=2546036 RepID=UPI0024B618E8|nr:spatacsin [Lampris incognitus]